MELGDLKTNRQNRGDILECILPNFVVDFGAKTIQFLSEDPMKDEKRTQDAIYEVIPERWVIN